MNPIPDLIDNRKRKLAEVLRSILAGAKESTMDVVTAFFNLRGLEELKPEIDTIAHLRVLLGKEQQQEFVVGERLLKELKEATSKGETTAREIKHWRDFLAQERVEIKRYEKTFCHGKTYIVTGIPNLGAMGIVGSSNFTGAGLTTNLELNAVLKQTSAVNDLQKWFENLWEEAEDYKAELLALLEHFTRTYTPYEIYIKIVYEALRDRLEQDLGEQDEHPSPIALADFQYEGYLAAKEILKKYGGVLIADSVGLGKTYLALRLLDDYAYRERQTALVVCPAAVMDTVWRPLLQEHGIPHEIVSMEKISRKDFPVDEYAHRFQIIVVDESHNFRNPNSNRWPNLFEIIRRGDAEKKVILLTATPVNNTVFDLYYQLLFITRGDPDALSAIGIKDLERYFKYAEQSDEALYEVLEALAVRRSRQFIRQNYPDAEIDGQKIHFPERELHTVRYSLKETYGEELYRRIAQTIENLLLAPYQLETYRKELIEARKRQTQLSLFDNPDETSDSIVQRLQKALGWSKEEAKEFAMTVGRQTSLAHIMRVLYLKRLESSVEALRISLRRLHRFLERFLKALEQRRLLSTKEYRKWIQMEASDEEGMEEENFEDLITSMPALDTERYDVGSIRSAVQADLNALREILSELEKKRHDDKLETLKTLLTSPDLVGKKVVLFSYFRDTARYVYQQLKNDSEFLEKLGHKRIAIVDSEVKPEERKNRVIHFAPRANGKPDMPQSEQIDLLISTDALSEGQNLQDGEVIINYDLHWNPVRMVQRIGRLDRIGSPHSRIHVYNFFPEQELEEILGLLNKLHEKLDAINRTVGLDASILGEKPNPMDFNILRKIQSEDDEAVQELEAMRELTIGEFLKQDLLQFLKDLGEEHLKRIPLGIGTARRAKKDGEAGFFAAFRNPVTGQHHWLFANSDADHITTRNLQAISHIRCDPSEKAVPLPEDFDPRPYINKLREHLWKKIRNVESSPTKLPRPQNQIVNLLRALQPSADRKRLLQYFESGALTDPDLKELRRLWKELSKLSNNSMKIKRLLEFVERHPQPTLARAGKSHQLAPEKEEDLECIAWMLVLDTKTDHPQ